jgi:hypothetical protein
LGLEGLGRGLFAEAVGGDGLGHRFDFLGRVALQDLTGVLGSSPSVAGIAALLLGAGHVVQQGRRPHDLQVCPLRLSNPLRQGQHPQHVIKVVGGVVLQVEATGFLNGDHHCPQRVRRRRNQEIIRPLSS